MTHPLLISVVEVIDIPVGLEGLMRWQPALHTAGNKAKQKTNGYSLQAILLLTVGSGNLPRQARVNNRKSVS